MLSWFLSCFLWFPVLFWRFILMVSPSFPPSVLFPRHFSVSTLVLSAVSPRVCSLIRPVCFTGSCSSVFECLVYVFCFILPGFLFVRALIVLLWTLPLVCTFLLVATLFCAFCVSTWFVDAHLFFFFFLLKAHSSLRILPTFSLYWCPLLDPTYEPPPNWILTNVLLWCNVQS